MYKFELLAASVKQLLVSQRTVFGFNFIPALQRGLLSCASESAAKDYTKATLIAQSISAEPPIEGSLPDPKLTQDIESLFKYIPYTPLKYLQ